MSYRRVLLFVIGMGLLSCAFAQQTPQEPVRLDVSFTSSSKVDTNPDDPEDPPDKEDPPIIYDEPLPTESAHIIYIIDASCSMYSGNTVYVDENGNMVSGSRIDRAKSEVISSIQNLPENWSFDIISFVCGQSACFSELREATEGNVITATSWVGGITPSGATGTGPAVSWALSLPAYEDCLTYVVVTDGAPNCLAGGAFGSWQTHLAMINAANTKGATIHGINIAPSTATQIQFVSSIAAQNGPGTYLQVD